MPEEIGEADTSETATTDSTPDVDGDEVAGADDVSDTEADTLKAQLEVAEEYGRNQKIRAEKAEQKARETAKAAPSDTKPKGESGTDLSSKDTIALINAKVHEDDVDEVVEYATFKKIPVTEALKSSVVKTLLTERAEQRSTAEATSTGKARGGSARVTGDTLLSKAQKTGEIPERKEDLEALIDARFKK